MSSVRAPLIAIRQQAVAQEKQRQRQYREELVIDVEAEVDRKKVRLQSPFTVCYRTVPL